LRLPFPRPPADGWLRWHKEVPGNYNGSGDWYVDGSLIDGPDRATARCGYALVLVDREGELLAYASGVPPAWVDSAAGAEAWAYAMVLKACPEVPRVTTDCMAVRSTLASGRASACGAARPLARIWNTTFDTLDGASLQMVLSKLRWMPAHTSASTAHAHRRSDGQRVTATDWRCNRLADALAKAAACSCRAPLTARQLYHAAKQLVEHSAAVIAVAAHAANHYTESAWAPSGKLVQTTRRDSAPPLLRAGAWGPRPATTSGPPCAAPADYAEPAPARATLERQRLEQDRATQLTYAKEAKARGAEAANAAEAQKELRFQALWRTDLEAKGLRASCGPSAAERLAALRARLAQRAKL